MTNRDKAEQERMKRYNEAKPYIDKRLAEIRKDKATPRPWTHWELKAGSTRTEAEVSAALMAINNYEALLEACREALSMLQGLGYSSGDVVDQLRQAIANAERS